MHIYGGLEAQKFLREPKFDKRSRHKHKVLTGDPWVYVTGRGQVGFFRSGGHGL